jgi:hypothetical protein
MRWLLISIAACSAYLGLRYAFYHVRLPPRSRNRVAAFWALFCVAIIVLLGTNAEVDGRAYWRWLAIFAATVPTFALGVLSRTRRQRQRGKWADEQGFVCVSSSPTPAHLTVPQPVLKLPFFTRVLEPTTYLVFEQVVSEGADAERVLIIDCEWRTAPRWGWLFNYPTLHAATMFAFYKANVDLPPFDLRPRDCAGPSIVPDAPEGWREVELPTEPAFCATYALCGPNPEALRWIFHPKTCADFERYPNWFAEGRHGWMLLYTFRRVMALRGMRVPGVKTLTRKDVGTELKKALHYHRILTAGHC